jgi:hypothetical protein
VLRHPLARSAAEHGGDVAGNEFLGIDNGGLHLGLAGTGVEPVVPALEGIGG